MPRPQWPDSTNSVSDVPGTIQKVVAPDRAAVLLWGARVDDELAGGGEHPRRLASKPAEVEVVHGIEAGHHVTGSDDSSRP